jgi:hypothetical protein
MDHFIGRRGRGSEGKIEMTDVEVGVRPKRKGLNGANEHHQREKRADEPPRIQGSPTQ